MSGGGTFSSTLDIFLKMGMKENFLEMGMQKSSSQQLGSVESLLCAALCHDRVLGCCSSGGTSKSLRGGRKVVFGKVGAVF